MHGIQQSEGRRKWLPDSVLYDFAFFRCSQVGNTYIGDVRIIARGTLRDFWLKHGDSEQPLKAWFQEAQQAEWSNPSEVKANYANASILKHGRVVFNIAGNKYRLVVMINYKSAIVFIRFIGTHEEYDRIDPEEI
jgi:mRNA interferase HigB